MIHSIQNELDSPVVRFLDRVVLRHLEKYALIIALICLIAIGLLH